MGTLKGAPGANVSIAFLLNTALLESPVYFLLLILYVKFYEVSFGGQNVQTHSVIGIRRDTIACRVSHALNCKEKIGIKV